MVNARIRKWELLLERTQAWSRPSGTLTAPLQRPEPHPAHSLVKLGERPVIARHPIVAVVSFEHLAQPGMLFHYTPVPAPAGLLLELRHLGAPLLPRSTASELELALATHATDVHEPQELERVGLWQPSAFAILSGKTSELDHPGLFRM